MLLFLSIYIKLSILAFFIESGLRFNIQIKRNESTGDSVFIKWSLKDYKEIFLPSKLLLETEPLLTKSQIKRWNLLYVIHWVLLATIMFTIVILLIIT